METAREVVVLDSDSDDSDTRAKENRAAPIFGNDDSGLPSCPICLTDILEPQEKAVTGCQHTFCRSCLGEWLRVRRFCPLCKDGAAGGDDAQERSRYGYFRPTRQQPQQPEPEPQPRPYYFRVQQRLLATSGATSASGGGAAGHIFVNLTLLRALVSGLIDAWGLRRDWATEHAWRHPHQEQQQQQEAGARDSAGGDLDRGQRAGAGSGSMEREGGHLTRERGSRSSPQQAASDAAGAADGTGSQGLEGPVAALQPFLFERAAHFWHEMRCFALSGLSVSAYDAGVRYSLSGLVLPGQQPTPQISGQAAGGAAAGVRVAALGGGGSGRAGASRQTVATAAGEPEVVDLTLDDDDDLGDSNQGGNAAGGSGAAGAAGRGADGGSAMGDGQRGSAERQWLPVAAGVSYVEGSCVGVAGNALAVGGAGDAGAEPAAHRKRPRRWDEQPAAPVAAAAGMPADPAVEAAAGSRGGNTAGAAAAAPAGAIWTASVCPGAANGARDRWTRQMPLQHMTAGRWAAGTPTATASKGRSGTSKHDLEAYTGLANVLSAATAR
eukprot:XP_001701929.1 predicted protein [Chlamydomonas reinhardtii]